jgi:hypothetical protein
MIVECINEDWRERRFILQNGFAPKFLPKKGVTYEVVKEHIRHGKRFFELRENKDQSYLDSHFSLIDVDLSEITEHLEQTKPFEVHRLKNLLMR